MKRSKSLQVDCPCGSGKPYPDCCGREGLTRKTSTKKSAETGKTRERELLIYRDASQALAENRPLHALNAAREILKTSPHHHGALALALGIPRSIEVFTPEETAGHIKNALKAYKGEVEMVVSAADAYTRIGKPEESEKLLQGVLEEDPHQFNAHFGMGLHAIRRHQLDLAEYHLRQAWHQRQVAPNVLRELGGVLSQVGRKDEAEHYFRIAHAQAPGDPSILVSMCRMEESRGNLERAWELLELAWEGADPSHFGLKLTEAVLHRRSKDYKRAILALDAIDFEKIDLQARAIYGIERCMTLDKLGLYDEAFDCAARSNALRENDMGLKYDAEKHTKLAASIRRSFTKARLSAGGFGARPFGPGEEQPIFICGFTRSGTSMLEQILSAHSNIAGGDELPFINDLAVNAANVLESKKDYPVCLFEKRKADQPPTFQVLRHRYLMRLRNTGILEPGVRKFTDKMPMNELHMGLIHGVFPEAKIIHIVRHPLDSVLSTFFTDASHGGYCSYRLEATAAHYRLLFEMTEHYRKKLGIEFLRVRYEDIVGNIRKEAKKILDFVGEELEQACIDFHENPRYARTASYAQVTEKLYDTSVARYRNYLRQLEPVLKDLKPVIKSLGYKI